MRKSIIGTACTIVFALITTYVNAETINLLTNGDFDMGPGVGWKVNSSTHPIVVDAPSLPADISPHSGNHVGWFGGVESGQDHLWQQFFVPIEATSVELNIYTWITSTEIMGGYDVFLVYIDGDSIMPSMDGSDQSDDWTQSTVDISWLSKGQNHSIEIIADGDEQVITNYFVDSVSINATVVPIPSAVYLFGSGLLGLIGLAKHKRT